MPWGAGSLAVVSVTGVGYYVSGGAQINTAGTTLEEAAEYMDGLRTYALLYHANGRWNVVDKAIGPTDAFWYGDPLYTRLPAGLMPD